MEDEIEEKIEQEVEKRLKERLEEKKEAPEIKNKVDHKEREVSRRDFLKKMGFGVAGIGALSILPSVSAFNIRTSNPLQYFGDNQTDPNFSVQPNGSLEAYSAGINQLNLIDTGSNPSSNGEIQRNGGDVKVHSGGATRNLSNVGGSIWTKHGEINASNDTSVTYNFSNSYNSVLLLPKTESNGPWIQMRVNGDTGSNYSYRKPGGSGTSGVNQIDRAFLGGQALAQRALLSGKWARDFTVSFNPIQSDDSHFGQNGSVTSPLNQVTLFNKSGNTFTIDVEVYVR